MLVTGTAGVGKSRFLEHLGSKLPEVDWLIIKAQPKRNSDPFGDAMADVSGQIAKLASNESLTERLFRLKHAFERLRRGFAEIAVASAQAIPAAGAVVSKAVQRASQNPLETPEHADRWHAIRDLISITQEIARRRRVLIIFDDIHDFDSAELDDLTLFVSGLEGSACQNTKVAIASRPVTEFSGQFNAWISSVNRSGLLAQLRLHRLDDEHIRVLAEGTIENSDQAEPLIMRASGNPQIFIEQLLRLNANGDLRKNGPLLVLPGNTTENQALSRSLWDALCSDVLQKRLLGTLALGRPYVPVRNLADFATFMGTTSNELHEIATKLDQERVLAWVPLLETNGEYALKFRHDLIRQQIRRAILDGPIGERLEFALLAERVLEAELEERVGSPSAYLKRASDLETPAPEISDTLISLLQDFCDVIGIVHSPSHRACVLGLIRCASLVRNHQAVLDSYLQIEAELKREISGGSDYYLRYAEMIIESNYHTGNFAAAIDQGQKLINRSFEIAYYVATSLLVLKSADHSGRTAISISEDILKNFEISSVEPKFRLLNAVAHQEAGDNDHAIGRYQEYLSKCPNKNQLTAEWVSFLAASPLFIKDEKALDLCSLAIQAAQQLGDTRQEAKAQNNYGIASLGVRDFESAEQAFRASEGFFRGVATHEVIFASNNLAVMSMLAGDYAAASDRLRSALFRTSSENYAVSLRMNLALARYHIYGEANIDRYDDACGSAHVDDHTYLSWMLEYNRTYLLLQSSQGALDSATLDDIVLRYGPYKRLKMARHYWNALIADIYGNHYPKNISLFSVPAKLPQETIDPSLSLMRPAMLAFGRT